MFVYTCQHSKLPNQLFNPGVSAYSFVIQQLQLCRVTSNSSHASFTTTSNVPNFQLLTCNSFIVSPPLPMTMPALLPGIIISSVTCPSLSNSGMSCPLLMIRLISSFAFLFAQQHFVEKRISQHARTHIGDVAEWVECWSRPANFPYPAPDC